MKNSLIKSLLLLNAFFLFTTVYGQSEKEMKKTVSQYVENILSSKGLYYDFKHRGEGTLSQHFPETEGTVKIIPKNHQFGVFDYARITATNNKGVKTNVSVSKGITYTVDETNKIVWRAPAYRCGVQMFNYQFIAPIVALEELSSAPENGAKVIGEEKIGTQDCLVIEYKAESINYKYVIGKADNWLYRVEGRKPEVWGNGAIIMEFLNPKLNEKYASKEFAINLPEGFTQKEYSGSFPAIGSDAPKWNTKTLKGQEISSENYKGKVLVIDFWSTWCGPCIQAMPHLQRLQEKYKGRLEVIGMNYDEKKDPLAFINKKGFTYTMANGEPLANAYKASLPLAYVIDPEGKIVDIFNGYFGKESDERIEKTIKNTLKKAGL